MNTNEQRNYFIPDNESVGPIRGERLYTLLDSGNLTKQEIGGIVRSRYPYTAAIVDNAHRSAAREYYQQPERYTHTTLTQAIGKVGAFNYIRGMEVTRRDGSIDREVAPRIMISPSAAVQMLENAEVKKNDRVLELFCGGGYGTFFLALEQPAVLDSLDLHTPKTLDLNQTFAKAYTWIYEEVPSHMRPAFTQPNFLQGDVQELPALAQNGTIRNDYTKVFLHPPYGRESQRMKEIEHLEEFDAFSLWMNTVQSLSEMNTLPFETYSVVPSEWISSLCDSDKKSLGVHVIPLQETQKFSLSLFATRLN